MRIDELSIKNFKGFENENFRFDPHFNVVIGKNASGKTSLLDALAICASTYVTGILDWGSLKFIKDNEIRTALIEGQPKPQSPAQIDGWLTLHEKSVGISIEAQYGIDTNNQTTPVHGLNTLEIESLARNDLKQSRTVGNKTTFPLIVYYGTTRLFKKNEEIHFFKQGEGVFAAYPGCLEPDLSLRDVFLSWIKTYEDEVAKFNQPLDELFLKVMKETISSMVPEWTDIAFSRKEDDIIGTFTDENGYVNKLPFKNLSDGYRNVIGMVADMVYRCIQLNPGLKENVLIETNGIVLIDELDLHLHPDWQKRIPNDLKRIFPKVQFIVTTHSPFIVQSLKKEELIVLGSDFVEGEDPWRKSVEEIAEEEMQVTDVQRSNRFIEMVAIAKEYYTLVKANDEADTLRAKIDTAKQRLDSLRVLYADDPAYVAMLEAELEKTEAHAAGN